MNLLRPKVTTSPSAFNSFAVSVSAIKSSSSNVNVTLGISRFVTLVNVDTSLNGFLTNGSCNNSFVIVLGRIFSPPVEFLSPRAARASCDKVPPRIVARTNSAFAAITFCFGSSIDCKPV